ncbi:MAG: hypothetical protein ACR2PD_09595, partial [Luminiphilus sp.]
MSRLTPSPGQDADSTRLLSLMSRLFVSMLAIVFGAQFTRFNRVVVGFLTVSPVVSGALGCNGTRVNCTLLRYETGLGF